MAEPYMSSFGLCPPYRNLTSPYGSFYPIIIWLPLKTCFWRPDKENMHIVHIKNKLFFGAKWLNKKIEWRSVSDSLRNRHSHINVSLQRNIQTKDTNIEPKRQVHMTDVNIKSRRQIQTTHPNDRFNMSGGEVGTVKCMLIVMCLVGAGGGAPR